METRKLQQVGGGTFTVSIPKEWATENDLEAGAEVHLYPHADGSIVLRSDERDGGRLRRAEIELDPGATRGSDGPALVRRALRAAQVVGFETVTLTPADSFTTDERRAVRSTVRTLVGTELAAESDDEIIVRNLLDAGDVSVRQSVVQLQFVALSVHRAATAAVLAGDGEARDRLRERRDEADRLVTMVSRHFARSLVSLEEVDRLGSDRPELFEYREAARQFGRVADQGVRLARVGDDLSEPLPQWIADDVREAAEASRGAVDDAATALLDGEVATAHAALDDCDAVRERIADIEGRLCDDSDAAADRPAVGADPPIRSEADRTTALSSTAAVAATRVLDDLARTADCGAAVAEVALRAGTRVENA